MERNHDPDIVSPGRAADAPQGQKCGKAAPANDVLAAVEEQSLNALHLWLDAHPPLSARGDVMEYRDGRPVALDILEVIAAIRKAG